MVAALGSIMIVEFLVVSALGLVVLFFTCKCAVLLVHEKIRGDIKDPNVSIHEPTVSTLIFP